MYRLGYFLIFILGFIACKDDAIQPLWEIDPDSQNYKNIERWEVFELSFDAEELSDTYSTPPLRGIFTHNGENKEINVNGFYDGDGVYKIRFMPTELGFWTFKLNSGIDTINGQQGIINCVNPKSDNHGMVQVSDSYHFSYEDGESYFPFGTTLYAWHLQGDALEEQTLNTLKSNSFNKIRMLAFPKNYRYIQNQPEVFPFEGSGRSFNYNNINHEYFQHLEQRIEQLQALGIETDLILFHPYDYWGFSRMGMEANKKYLQYMIARFGAYRSIWWSMANEYQLVEGISDAEWNELGQYVSDNDPYGHLLSIHNANGGFYDFTKQWITHVSIQVQDLAPMLQWQDDYQKPIVADEVGYEGNIPDKWGNLSAEKMLFQFWVGTTRGGYVSHGETYQHPDDILWWSKGGQLYGETPERITFLQQIVNDYGKGLQGKPGEDYIAEGEGYILHYLGEQVNNVYSYELPDNAVYKVELIDTWNMTIQSIGNFQNDVQMDIPSKKYLAVRMQKQ